MADGDPITDSETSVADDSDFIVDGSEASTGAIDLTELGGTGDADVFREVDTAGDGSWATSVRIAQVTGEWHSQKNLFTVSQNQNTRLRVHNTSGSAAEYYASGYEVSDNT